MITLNKPGGALTLAGRVHGWKSWMSGLQPQYTVSESVSQFFPWIDYVMEIFHISLSLNWVLLSGLQKCCKSISPFPFVHTIRMPCVCVCLQNWLRFKLLVVALEIFSTLIHSSSFKGLELQLFLVFFLIFFFWSYAVWKLISPVVRQHKVMDHEDSVLHTDNVAVPWSR